MKSLFFTLSLWAVGHCRHPRPDPTGAAAGGIAFKAMSVLAAPRVHAGWHPRFVRPEVSFLTLLKPSLIPNKDIVQSAKKSMNIMVLCGLRRLRKSTKVFEE